VFVAKIAPRRGRRQQPRVGGLQAEAGDVGWIPWREKKDEDLFDKYLYFSVNTSRFYCWHCSSVGIKQAKLNL
jgi:hypothetical protein